MTKLKDITIICSLKHQNVMGFIGSAVGSIYSSSLINGYLRDVHWLFLLGYINSDECDSLNLSLRSLIKKGDES